MADNLIYCGDTTFHCKYREKGKCKNNGECSLKMYKNEKYTSNRRNV
jgi:hypothetical protein